MEQPTPTRRSVLGGVGITLAGLSGFQYDDATADGEDEGYLVRQDDECIPVTPLSGDVPVKEFYDYRVPNPDSNPYAVNWGNTYSSHGTVDLQRPDASTLFLYDGPEGVSLVIVHGKYVDGDAEFSGGSATFELTNLPEDGQWVVQDDEYEGTRNFDRWDKESTETRVDWTWGGGRTDGGVFGGVTTDDEIELRPRFNEGAELYGEHYDGLVESWQLLTGDLDSPERHELALDKPITIESGTCSTSRTERPVELPLDLDPGVLDPTRPGRITLEVGSTDKVAVETIDPETIRFGPDGAKPEEVKLVDGDRTLRLKFEVPELGLDADDTGLSLRAETTSGRRLYGTASFRIPGKPEEHDQEGVEEDDDEDGHEQKEAKEEEKEAEEEREEEKAERKEEREEEKAERKAEKEERNEERKEAKEEEKEAEEERKEDEEEVESSEDSDEDDDDDDDEDGGDDEGRGPPDGVPGRGPKEDD